MKFKREASAGGIVYKQDGDKTLWLILQHSKHKGWGFPKGHIGDKIKDESMESAALREVEEEGGIKAKIVSPETFKKEYMYRFQDFLIKKAVYYFLMEYISGDIANHDFEVSDIKLTDEDEVRSTLSFKTDKDAFEKALTLFKQIHS